MVGCKTQYQNNIFLTSFVFSFNLKNNQNTKYASRAPMLCIWPQIFNNVKVFNQIKESLEDRVTFR